MRIVAVLLALWVVGLLVARQLGDRSPARVERPAAMSDGAVPAMPVRPQDVRGLERQLEGHVNDLAAERARQMERAASGQ